MAAGHHQVSVAVEFVGSRLPLWTFGDLQHVRRLSLQPCVHLSCDLIIKPLALSCQHPFLIIDYVAHCFTKLPAI